MAMRLKGKLSCECPLKKHHLHTDSSYQQASVRAIVLSVQGCRSRHAGYWVAHTCPPEQPKAIWCWLPLLQVVSSGMATPGLSSCSKKENFFQPKPMAISRLAFEFTI